MTTNLNGNHIQSPPIPIVTIDADGLVESEEKMEDLTPNTCATPSKSAPKPAHDGETIESSPHRVNLTHIVAKYDHFEEHYDSDSCFGPFYDAVDEERPQIFDDEEVPVFYPSTVSVQQDTNTGLVSDADTSSGSDTTPPAAPPTTNQHVKIGVEQILEMKKPELQYELRIRGGVKRILWKS